MTDDKKKARTIKLFVGYRTRLVEGIEANLPEFKAPANYRDAEKIAQDLAEKKRAFLENAKDYPYVGTIDEIFLLDPYLKDGTDAKAKALQWKWHPPEDNKPRPAVRLRNYVTKHYPGAWATDLGVKKQTEVVFVGFDPRTLLKMVGLECSLPDVGKPCPLGMWYGNSDHRDIGKAIVPDEYSKVLSVPYALQFRRPTDPDDATAWDALVKDWTGPGVTPQTDAMLAMEIANQMGFLEE